VAAAAFPPAPVLVAVVAAPPPAEDTVTVGLEVTWGETVGEDVTVGLTLIVLVDAAVRVRCVLVVEERGLRHVIRIITFGARGRRSSTCGRSHSWRGRGLALSGCSPASPRA
jgi:hypothetical protein